ncbi:MAG TPA: aspartate carbamoyltransferase [Candidatus Kapabacteria bacterium]|nr:aspartate carbamoyltransferase [Candidatus Kapabacteria bacterium]
MNPRHIVESQQFTVPLLRELFERTRQMERIVARGGTLDYAGRIMATLFYKPSTRTRFSFEAAMYRLGGRVLSTEQAREFSSVVEGEQLEDTIRIIANYCDAIVVRHNEEGGARRAAAVSAVPVINAGDGAGGQHPTQALLDLYTIYNECRTLDGLSVAIIGALDRGRTARSLAYLLGKFERTRLYFIAPEQMQIGADILEYLDEHGVSYELLSSADPVIAGVDVVYQTRIDRERLVDRELDVTRYNIDTATLARMKQNAIVMHPLPRSVEIDHAVDADPRASYFRQARNGLTVRMALLAMLMDGE